MIMQKGHIKCGHLYLFFTAKVIYYNHSHIRELHIFVYDVFLFSGDYFNFIIESMFEYRSSVAVLDLRSIFYFLSMFLSYTLYICVNLAV